MRITYTYQALICLVACGCAFLFCQCSKDSTENIGSSEAGVGGSMARFTIVGDCLYTVDMTTMRIFDISDSSKPVYMPGKDQDVSGDAETIFPMDTLLFIGSRNGMYIYNVSNPQFPQRLSHASHLTSCDPVVAKGNYAYVTLNSGNQNCGRQINRMLVFDISDPSQPEEVFTYADMMLPRGLGIDNDRLFVCDNGIKVFSLENPAEPEWINDLSESELVNIDAYDIIPLAGNLMVIGQNGLYQYTYLNDRFSLLSRILISRPSDKDNHE